MTKWIKAEDKVPTYGKKVLIFFGGNYSVAKRKREWPTHEESWEAFDYWDSEDHCLEIDWGEVTHWMPLPELPND